MQLSQFQRGVSLRDVLPHGRFFGGADIEVTSCSSDPQVVRPGDLYVAIDEANRDGHQFAIDAIQRGAVGVLAERILPIAAPHCVVPDTNEAFGQVCQRLAGTPSRRLRTVGITGTNGKTTVSLLLASIFKAARQRTGIVNSFGFFDAFERFSFAADEPTSPELAESMAQMASNQCANCVLELSSRSLSQQRAAGVEFDIALLTNVRRDHLDFHGTIFNYRRAKSRLFRQLKPDGVAIFNADDPASKFVAKHVDRHTITFGVRTPADVRGTVVERHAGEQTFLLTAGSETVAVQTRLFGDHQLLNCLAAAAAALSMGIDLKTIARGLESTRGIPGRMESIACGQPFGVYVDAARAPDSLAAALKSLRQVTDGRVICVFGAAGDGDADQRPLLGRVVERHANVGIITNDNPGCESPLQIAHDIIDGYDRPASAHVLPSRKEAIHWALGQANAGDAVLIAGKGDRCEQVIGHTVHPFDDRAVARQWLEEFAAQIEYEPRRRHVIPFPGGIQMAN